MPGTPFDRADTFTQEQLAVSEAAATPGFQVTYYSASQAEIYFQDFLVDELVSLDYQLVTNRRPLYGYASSLFDVVADGNSIVQGSFTINYIDSNYVMIIAQAIKDRQLEVYSDDYAEFPFIEELDRLITATRNGSGIEVRKVENMVRGLGNKEFLEFAAARRNKKLDVGPIDLNSQTPFDIFLVVGDTSDPEVPYGTTRTLHQVFLTGQAQRIVADSSVILERYNFIAREMR